MSSPRKELDNLFQDWVRPWIDYAGTQRLKLENWDCNDSVATVSWPT